MSRHKPQAVDITGQRFTRLVVLGRAPKGNNKLARWHCQCDCGKKTISLGTKLRNGSSKSCGCYSHELAANRIRTHGACKDKAYSIWTAIKGRCFNANHSSYYNYGARGITMCDEWRYSYQAFSDYVGEPPSAKHTIERLDNSRGYEPGNVKWATRKEQNRNTRVSRMVTFNGQTMCIGAWSEQTGISYDKLWWRIVKAGWPLERAFSLK